MCSAQLMSKGLLGKQFQHWDLGLFRGGIEEFRSAADYTRELVISEVIIEGLTEDPHQPLECWPSLNVRFSDDSSRFERKS